MQYALIAYDLQRILALMPRPPPSLHPVAEGGRRRAGRGPGGPGGAVWDRVCPSYAHTPRQTLAGANTVKQRVWTKLPASSNKTLEEIRTFWSEPFL
jgi:hypothetical protein